MTVKLWLSDCGNIIIDMHIKMWLYYNKSVSHMAVKLLHSCINIIYFFINMLCNVSKFLKDKILSLEENFKNVYENHLEAITNIF